VGQSFHPTHLFLQLAMANYAIPRAILAPSRSAFAVIDPVTEQYSRVLDRSGLSQLSQSRRSGSYFAISYVWSEWKDSPEDELPSWTQIRERLLQLSTTSLVTSYNKPSIELAGDLPLKFFQPDPTDAGLILNASIKLWRPTRLTGFPG
jgi:hypothetical protein